ncbi:MAG: hypothetical protein VCA37_15030 [Roseibacillus sp.]
MIYRIKEKFWSWGNDFTIGDEAGSVQMKINFFESADLNTSAPFTVNPESVSLVDGSICFEFAPTDDAGDLSQGLTSTLLAPHRESPALAISQAKRFAAELLSEAPIFFAQIVDQVFLLAVQPPGHGQDEELRSRGHPPRPCGSGLARTSLFPCAQLCRPFFSAPTGGAIPLSESQGGSQHSQEREPR